MRCAVRLRPAVGAAGRVEHDPAGLAARGETAALKHVRRGEQLAFIINPCDGSVREVLKAPVTGMLFFMQDGPFITEHSPVFQVLAGA